VVFAYQAEKPDDGPSIEQGVARIAIRQKIWLEKDASWKK